MNQRIKNHEQDMNHSHTMEAKLKPEMSVKPSALWQRREVGPHSIFCLPLVSILDIITFIFTQHFQSTAASLRGQQLLDHARGKKSGEAVFAGNLAPFLVAGTVYAILLSLSVCVTAESLVTRHDFFGTPQDTTYFNRAQYERTYK
jgi:hypothetical protein